MAREPGAMGGKRAEMAEDVPSLINSITGSGSVDSKGFDGATAMDEDLVGDDVKILNYTIVFTKRDAEAVLQTDREEIVDYPTDEASFAGLKVAEFLERVERDGIPWPADWMEPPGDGYPAVGQPIRQIPEGDRKFLLVSLSVKSRRPKAVAEFDRDRTEVLRRIRAVNTE